MEYVAILITGIVIGFIITLITVLINRTKNSAAVDIDEIIDSAKDEILDKIKEVEETMDDQSGEFKSHTVTVDNAPLFEYIDKKFDELRISMCEIGIGSLIKAISGKGTVKPSEVKIAVNKPAETPKTPKTPDNAEVGSGSDTPANPDNAEVSSGSEAPKTPANPDNTAANSGSEVPVNKEEPKKNKAAEKGYKRFLVYLSHKEVSQTNFMSTDGDYVEYADVCEDEDSCFADAASAKKEADEMSADKEFEKFTVGVCAVTDDGPKFLTKEELEEIL